jgi:hypothetical protein
LYQPIKLELARALAAGRLPFWSDHFGLGVPLVAESHAAAFYLPNWFFYRLWDVPTAYRLTLWVHMLALVAATFAYARNVGIGYEGSALAAISFALCGFQAVHAVHEPFYHSMPYLPLCLLLAGRYATTGEARWLAGLALAWGLQITLGHFQIQMWTGGLAFLSGCWRVATSRNGIVRKLGRVVGLLLGLSWGAAIAWVQLRLTWELTGVAGFVRPSHLLANHLLPPAHWAQFALPALFLGRPLGLGDAYWGYHGTIPGEACAYVGVVPLVLAVVGMVATPRDRALTLWRFIVLLTLALATMPGWWPDGFFILLQLPGLGWFRAPARYTLLTSLGLALLAGRGLDRAVGARRFWNGLALAFLVGVLAWAWSVYWSRRPDFQAGLGADTMAVRFAASGLSWILGVAAIISWRKGWLRPWAPIGLAVLELAGLFFLGPVKWQWVVRLPEASSVLRQLAALPDSGLVAGRLLNLPVTAGRAVAFPNLGITPPPPNDLLESATVPPGRITESEGRWQRRFGATVGVWGSADDVRGTEPLAEITDPALDRVMKGVPLLKRGGGGPWKLVRIPFPFPSAWAARRIRKAAHWGELYSELASADALDEAWFFPEDSPPLSTAPRARQADVTSWNGQTAVVEHDGWCVLILRRTYYPGWVCRVDGGPEQPVLKVDGGLQGVYLEGSGISRVTVRYRPTGLTGAGTVTFGALVAAVIVLAGAGWKTLKRTGFLAITLSAQIAAFGRILCPLGSQFARSHWPSRQWDWGRRTG